MQTRYLVCAGLMICFPKISNMTLSIAAAGSCGMLWRLQIKYTFYLHPLQARNFQKWREILRCVTFGTPFHFQCTCEAKTVQVYCFVRNFFLIFLCCGPFSVDIFISRNANSNFSNFTSSRNFCGYAKEAFENRSEISQILSSMVSAEGGYWSL